MIKSTGFEFQKAKLPQDFRLYRNSSQMSMATNQTVKFRLELARGIYSLLLNVHSTYTTYLVPTVYVQCICAWQLVGRVRVVFLDNEKWFQQQTPPLCASLAPVGQKIFRQPVQQPRHAILCHRLHSGLIDGKQVQYFSPSCKESTFQYWCYQIKIGRETVQ